jgi:hypothetical protein
MILIPLYYLFFFVSLFLPGYVLISKLAFYKKSPGIELALGYTISILFYAFLATAAYVFGINLVVTRLVTALILIVSLLIFITERYYTRLRVVIFPIFCIALLSVLATVFVALSYVKPYQPLPDPTPSNSSNYSVFDVKILNISKTQANDNSIPYRQAQFYLHRFNPAKDAFIREWSVTFFVRTPLMGAVTANYLNLFNEKTPPDLIWKKSAIDKSNTYVQFQVLAHIMNSLFLLPGFLILSRLFNKKTAMLSSLFLVCSPFFLYNAFFTWPKSLVAFFILTGWVLLLKNKLSYTLAASVVFGAAYLSHDLAILYLGATAVFLIVAKRLRDLILIAATPLIFALTWLLISSRHFHQTSGFVYYPFSTEDIPQPSQYSSIVQKFLHTSPLRILTIRLDNLYFLLTPYQLFKSQLLHAPMSSFWSLTVFSVPGALGIGLVPAVFISLFARLKGFSFWVLAVGAVFFESLLIGWPHGLGALHFAEAEVVLLTGISVAFLLTLKKTYFLSIAFILNVLGLIVFMLFSYGFHIGLWVHSIKDVVCLLTIGVILFAIGWIFLNVQQDKKTVFHLPE